VRLLREGICSSGKLGSFKLIRVLSSRELRRTTGKSEQESLGKEEVLREVKRDLNSVTEAREYLLQEEEMDQAIVKGKSLGGIRRETGRRGGDRDSLQGGFRRQKEDERDPDIL